MHFETLTPDTVISAIQDAMEINLTGLLTPFPSYINRVYEIETEDEKRLVAKFYRPGRWSERALLDEHLFIMDCAQADISVVPPLELQHNTAAAVVPTLGKSHGFYFALFPKKSGRLFELNCDEDYLRVGSLIGRIHLAGKKREADDRIILDPALSTKGDIAELLAGSFMPETLKREFETVCTEIVHHITPLFSGVEKIRIHGDCHPGNILCRPGRDGSDELMVIDFDDMAMGPAVQDLLLLLPGHLKDSRKEFNLLAEGYEHFMEFDYTTARLIEPLRAMRIIYFLAWSARQVEDAGFYHHFPWWGTEDFWKNEIRDLANQLDEIREG